MTRTPTETVAMYERVMDRGGNLSTADWHAYEAARREVAIEAAAEAYRFPWEPVGEPGPRVVLKNRRDFDIALAEIIAEHRAAGA